MKKLKLTDWFDSVADRVSATDGEKLISANALSFGLRGLMGNGCAIPFPCMKLKGPQVPGANMVEGGIADMFKDKFGAEVPVHEAEYVKKKYVTACYTRAEVCEWLWYTVAGWIEARIQSLMPRAAAKRHELSRRGIAKFAAVEGSGWPDSDAEWERCATFIGRALGYGDSGRRLTTTDEIVTEIAESCSYAIGVPVDESIIHEHVAPLCLQLEPSLFLAKTLLRTFVVDAVVGSSLAMIIRRHQFEIDWGHSQPWGTEEANPLAEVIKELLETRKQMIAVQVAVASGRLDRAREACGNSIVVTSTRRRLENLQCDKSFESSLRFYQQASLLASSNMTFVALRRSMAFITELNMTGSVSNASHAGFDKLFGHKGLRNYVMNMEEAIENLDREWICKAFIHF